MKRSFYIASQVFNPKGNGLVLDQNFEVIGAKKELYKLVKG